MNRLKEYDFLVGQGYALAGHTTRHGGGVVASHRERLEHAQKIQEVRNSLVAEIRAEVIQECLDAVMATNADLCARPPLAYRACIDAVKRLKDAE